VEQFGMDGTQEHGLTLLTGVSKAMVRLHKEQFGRGPVDARSDFAGPDGLVCTLRGVLLPAEVKMVGMGDQARVRESRMAFQAATEHEFVDAVEAIVGRKVNAFASGLDANADVAFEMFHFEPRNEPA
jgi:uncharacterized protein YbcI